MVVLLHNFSSFDAGIARFGAAQVVTTKTLFWPAVFDKLVRAWDKWLFARGKRGCCADSARGFENMTGNSSETIIGVLKSAKTIALVGASANPARDSHEVMAFLQAKGHRVIPVNPGLAGQMLLGEKVYPDLASVPHKVDMVDVFRNPEAAGPVVDEAVAIGAKAVWMQLGVVNEAAALRGRQAGLTVIMDRCPKIEYSRFAAELG
jgi:predicted CoA-binding protein